MTTYVAGSDPGGTSLIINDTQMLAGRIGVLVGLPAGQSFVTGARELVRFTFAARTGSVTQATPVGFADLPVVREIDDDGLQIGDPIFMPVDLR